ncbi:MAG: L-2-hydroxyglutarate oxidase [Aestuariibacter sp.]
MEKVDITIIGAGIVGAAVAYQLQKRWPQKKIVILEKESAPAQHQTGRNSGVIHAGVYYAPGSLKAKYCRQGLADTYEFCRKYQIAHQQTGKLLVATNEVEAQRMEQLYARCQQNQLQPLLLSGAELKSLEPNISGVGAIFVEQTGIADYRGITECLLQQVQANGGTVYFQQQVRDVEERSNDIQVVTQNKTVHSELLINCGGLHSDRIIRMLCSELDFAIVPFKGEYYLLPPKYNDVVKHLIYPIPDPDLPFLGVHLTRMVDGSVTVGPNAVLAFGREAYNKSSFDWQDTLEMMRFSGFRKVLKNNFKSGLQEFKNSLFKPGYLKLVQKYCPQIELQDLLPYPSGIRAQAVSKDGELIHDFKFVETNRSLHVGNAPSPAATSAMPIARAICDKLSTKI